MSLHNTKPGEVVSNEPVRVETDLKDMRALKSKVVDANELSIVDDDNPGGDPYNTTGQHLVIKSRIDAEE